jgi:hypothetical protein
MNAPRKLRDLLALWTPNAKLRGIDAASAVAAAWPQVVGDDIARRTRPGQIRDGVLTVYTAGSTWSHQLSFLAPAIIASLTAACPAGEIKRLRFAVASGRTKALLDGASGPAAKQRGRGSSAGTPHASSERIERIERAETADAVVRRLRRSQRLLDRERVQAGWQRCPRCHAWRERGAGASPDCAVCAHARRAELDGRVERILFDAPWLRREDVTEHVPQAGEREYARVRRRLLTRWEEQLHEARRRLNRDALTPSDRIVAWSYLMLRSRLPKNDIGRALVADVLGPDWASALGPEEGAVRQAPIAARANHRKATARALQRPGKRHG